MVGLGNPGVRYARTRHNAGYRALEQLVRSRPFSPWTERFGGFFCESLDGDERIGGLLPQTFMNRSGESVTAAVEGLDLGRSAEDLIVAVDDLDLPLGRLRLRPRGSSGGHRGLESVIEHLGHSEFTRLRIGIGRPREGQDPVGYVLDDFSSADEASLGEALQRAARAIETVIGEGVGEAMSRFNRADLERG